MWIIMGFGVGFTAQGLLCDYERHVKQVSVRRLSEGCAFVINQELLENAQCKMYFDKKCHKNQSDNALHRN